MPLSARRRIFCQLFFIGWLAAAPASAQSTLRVLTYNVERAFGSSSAQASAQPALAEVVNYLAPDVWMISELGGTSATFSRSAALGYVESFVSGSIDIFGENPRINEDYYVSIASYHDGYETTAFISRYPFLEARTYSDAAGGYSALRGLNYVLVDVPGAAGGVAFFNMHLKASSDSASAGRRQAEAMNNATIIASWMTLHPGVGVIVGGDWNASADSDDGGGWTGHAVGDSITLANGAVTAYDPVGTLLGAGLTDPRPVSLFGDKDTFSSSSPGVRYDYLTYAGDNLAYLDGLVFNAGEYSLAQLASMNALAGTSLGKSTSIDASDHLPVLGVFAIVPEPGTVLLVLVGVGFAGLAGAAIKGRRGTRI